MGTKYVVVWDPTGRWHEGSIMGEEAKAAESTGAVLLPVDTDSLRLSGVGGWSKRTYGEGVVLGQMNGPAAPIVLYCTPNLFEVSWAARLVPAPLTHGSSGLEAIADRARAALLDGHGANGVLRIASDTSQRAPRAHAPIGSHVVAPDIRKLGKPDQFGGWTVRGHSKVHVASEDIFPFSLHGAASGLAIEWFAVSQHGG
jgi:hypothetical protein